MFTISTKIPFFSAAVLKLANNMIITAKLGLISDPPGYPLYYKMGIDHDGLPYYCCVYGTNSVEGRIHMTIHRDFGSLCASPEPAIESAQPSSGPYFQPLIQASSAPPS